ncbi:MAG TPA: cupin domain-containing protein [Dehalococcoidia bacterium]|jgi:quercetin dioxygenase-like cupin family protein|nr:cupin domain-containing protein [Dehalococcoidia bacterium]
MAEAAIWNLKEVLERSRVSDEDVKGKGFAESISRTFLVQSKYLSVVLVQAQPQTSPYLHTHQDHDEVILVLEGEGEFVSGDITKKVGPGDLIYAPAGTVHAPNFPGKAVRLAIYAPHFDPDRPDRVEVKPSGWMREGKAASPD